MQGKTFQHMVQKLCLSMPKLNPLFSSICNINFQSSKAYFLAKFLKAIWQKVLFCYNYTVDVTARHPRVTINAATSTNTDLKNST